MENPRKLSDAVEREVEAMTPILLCGVSGYDASTNVRDLCAASNTQCVEIALGAEEVCVSSFICTGIFNLFWIWVVLIYLSSL